MPVAGGSLYALGILLLQMDLPEERHLSFGEKFAPGFSVRGAQNPLSSEDLRRVRNPFSKRAHALPRALHFTATDVVHYFTSVLDVPPKHTKEGSIIFEEKRSRWPEDHYRIFIAQENGDVVVSFAVAGNYGMNLAREFFECPLFHRAESEQLYKLLGEAEKAPTATLPRFSVSFRSWETKERAHVVLRFFRLDGALVRRSTPPDL